MKPTSMAATAFACLLVGIGSATAQNSLPSSKATAAVNTLVKCNMTRVSSNDASAVLPGSCVNLWNGATVATKNEWIEIMATPVKLSNSQSLFVSASLVSGLYTQTRTKTQPGTTSTAQAMGAVYLRAVLTPAGRGDDIVGAPLNVCSASIFGCADPTGRAQWGVVLDSRIQAISQDLSACTVLVSATSGTCDITSTIELILNTASANAFNFIFPNVGQGVYTVKIYAAVGSDASVIGSGSAVGAAAFGLGSMTVESVRLVNNFEF
jgi:hypothetical protein